MPESLKDLAVEDDECNQTYGSVLVGAQSSGDLSNSNLILTFEPLEFEVFRYRDIEVQHWRRIGRRLPRVGSWWLRV